MKIEFPSLIELLERLERIAKEPGTLIGVALILALVVALVAILALAASSH